MPELFEILECDDEAVEENLMSKSRSQLQSLVKDIWHAEFCPSSLIALETILSGMQFSQLTCASLALTVHEELLEVCEFVVNFLWHTSLPEEYRESTTVFLTECVRVQLAIRLTQPSLDPEDGRMEARTACPSHNSVAERTVRRKGAHLPALISLEPFALALLASLLGGWENWQLVSKHLCAAVSYAFTSTDRIISSATHRRVCSCTSEPKYWIDQVLGFCLPASWNVVLLGLMRLCFGLIDFASPSGRIGASADLQRRPTAACLSRRPPAMMPSRRAVTTYAAHHFGTVSRAKQNARICRLAVNTLTDIFQTYPSVRQDLIAYALSKLWSDPKSPACYQITELLAELAALCPFELTESAAVELENLLDGLAILPLELASSVLQAFLPLFTVATHSASSSSASSLFNVDVRPLDAFLGLQARVVAELRSMSTCFRVRVRRIAVAGFVKLLKNLKVKASNFQSASQNSLSSQSQMSSTQSWLSMAPCAFPLFTQINSTQVVQTAVTLPSDSARNEALCTEIVGLLQRLVSSTLLASSPATQRDDPEALVKSDIYWGLCEVAMFNPGLVSPVLTLFWRLLSKCLDPALSTTKPIFDKENGSTSLPDTLRAVPLRLSQLIGLTEPDSILAYREHPEVLAWCLQIILALPALRSLWPRFCRNLAGEDSQASGASIGFTQTLTQSSVSSVCGMMVSNKLFAKVAHLLFNLSAALRETPLDEFGLMPETELSSSSPVGRLNQARLKMLLGLYDACLEFEARNPLASIARAGASWAQLKRLFNRREAARKLLFDRSTPPPAAGAAVTAEPAGDATVHNETTVAGDSPLAIGNSTGLAGQNLCFIGMSEDAARGGQLRGALLLSSLRSAVAGLRQALKSAPRGGGFAPHLLQTIAARLAELLPTGRASSGASQPVLTAAYREAFVAVIGKTARLLIRFYVAVIAQSGGGRLDAEGLGPVASAAIALLALCFAVVTDVLGTARLHRVAVALYPVVVTPKPLHLFKAPQTEAAAGDNPLLVEDSVVETDSEEEEEQGASCLGMPASESSPTCSPSQALTALVKLIKSWVTRILTSISSAELASSAAAANDLTTLLPLLISLCEARSAISRSAPNSDDSSTGRAAAAAIVPDFTGLDRVLLWLVRLLTRQSPKLGSSAAPLHAQLTRLALQLAHLLGSAAAAGSAPRRASSSATAAALRSTQSTRDSSSSEDMDALSWDDLIVLLATDLRTVSGDLEESDDSQPAERRLNFAVVSKSSASSILSIVLSALFEAYEDFSWLVDYLSQEVNQTMAMTGAFAQFRRPLYKFSELPDAMQAREEVVCSGLLTIAEALDELLQTNISAPSHVANELARLVTCVYNLLGNLVKHYLTLIQRNLGTFPPSFERVVRIYGRQVMPHAYAFVYYLQMCESEKARLLLEAQSLKKSKPGAAASKANVRKPSSKRTVNRVPKDLKLLPQLIGALEQYESSLCRLSKKTKVSFTDGVLPGLSRDFRVNRDAVLTALEEYNEVDSSLDSEVDVEEGVAAPEAASSCPAQPDNGEEVEENGGGSSLPKAGPPPSKRPCLGGRSNVRQTGLPRSQHR